MWYKYINFQNCPKLYTAVEATIVPALAKSQIFIRCFMLHEVEDLHNIPWVSAMMGTHYANVCQLMIKFYSYWNCGTIHQFPLLNLGFMVVFTSALRLGQLPRKSLYS